MEFSPYPKIRALGYKGTEKIKDLPVFISEKLDGSNVSIHRTEEGLRLASRTRWMDMESKQFFPFILWVKEHEAQLLKGLVPGEALWGEFCNNHNVLKYKTKHPFVVFDFSYSHSVTGARIFESPHTFTGYYERRKWEYLSFVDQKPAKGLVDVVGMLKSYNEQGSMLGGPIEGVVIKCYTELGDFGEPLFVKLVNEDFKEDFKKVYAVGDSLEEALCQIVFSEARFRKGLQRLKDNEEYTGTVQDIPKILSTIQKDIAEESMETVKEYLVKKYWTSAKKLLNYKIVQRYKQEISVKETGHVI